MQNSKIEEASKTWAAIQKIRQNIDTKEKSLSPEEFADSIVERYGALRLEGTALRKLYGFLPTAPDYCFYVGIPDDTRGRKILFGIMYEEEYRPDITRAIINRILIYAPWIGNNCKVVSGDHHTCIRFTFTEPTVRKVVYQEVEYVQPDLFG